MNIRRGLFRLWLVLSVLWVLTVGAFSYQEISRDLSFSPRFPQADGSIAIVPIFCGMTRGIAGKDYTTKDGQSPGPWDTYAKPNPFDNCWYELPAFRKLWPEYADMADDTLTTKLYRDVAEPIKVINPAAGMKSVALLAIIPPIVLLLFGSLFVWVIAGFARPKEPPLVR